MRIVIVGESNPYGSNPAHALYPAPDGCSGHRLCCLILQMHRKAYINAFERVNLCDGKWSNPAARHKAVCLWQDGSSSRFILLGSKVSKAFGVPFVPFEISEGGTMLCLPHPSGLNRLWNKTNIIRARETVKVFLEDVPEIVSLIGATQEVS